MSCVDFFDNTSGDIGVATMTASLILMGLYLIGLAVGWIIRGFMKDAPV
jgi:hypothetical protein